MTPAPTTPQTAARAPVVVLALLAVVAFCVTLVFTRDGPKVSPDSAVYLATAQNVADGAGLTTPFTFPASTYTPAEGLERYGEIPLVHFPPLYPTVLAIGPAIDVGAQDVHRLVAALGFALVVVGAAFVAWVLSAARTSSAIATGMLVLLGPSATQAIVGRWSWPVLSTWVLSETITMVFVLGGVIAAARALSTGRAIWLVAAAGAGALAVLTRYGAVAVPMAVVVAILIWRPWSWARRVGAALTVGVGSLLPLGIFLVWGAATSGQRARPLGLRGVDADELESLAEVVGGWFAPGGTWGGVAMSLRVLLTVGVVLLVSVELRTAWRGAGADRQAPLRLVSALTILAVPFVVFVSRSVFDAGIPIDGRLLAPAQPLLAALVVARIDRELVARHVRSAGWWLVGGAVVISLVALPGTLDALDRSPRTPVAGSQAIEEIASRAPLFSDSPTGLWLDYATPSLLVPVKRHSETGRVNTSYDDEMTALDDVITRTCGALVVYGSLGDSLPSGAELTTTLDVALVDPGGQGQPAVWQSSACVASADDPAG